MTVDKFEVIVTNEILGNSTHIMSLQKISKFNVVAYSLALRCLEDRKEHSSGMWTVRPIVNSKGTV